MVFPYVLWHNSMSSLGILLTLETDRCVKQHLLELWAFEQRSASERSAVVTGICKINDGRGDFIHEGEGDDLEESLEVRTCYSLEIVDCPEVLTSMSASETY